MSHALIKTSVVVTRASASSLDPYLFLIARGVTIHRAPLIATAPTGATLPPLSPSDWVVFTSQRAVAALAGGDRLALPGLAECSVAAVGPATARALQRAGRAPDLVPVAAHALGLLAALDAVGHISRVVYPCAAETQGTLEAGLAARSIPLVRVPVYATVCPEGAGAALDAALPADVITLASGSAARHLAALGRDLGGARIAVIGPSTEAACRSLGLRVDAVAAPHTADGLAAAAAALLEQPGD